MSRWSSVLPGRGRRPGRAAPSPAGSVHRGSAGPPVEDVDGVLLVRSVEDDSFPLDVVAEVAGAVGGEEDVVTVIVGSGGGGPAADHWARLGALLDSLRARGTDRVRLVMSGAGDDRPGRPSVARRIADAWELEVTAPDGAVLITPGGTLFVHGDSGAGSAWWRFAPGAQPRKLGRRAPAPAWEEALGGVPARTGGGCVVDRIPAGVVIRPAEAPGPAPDDLCFSVPVDFERLTVLVGAPHAEDVAADEVAAVIAGLPEPERARVRLAPGGRRDLLRLGQSVADLTGAEVEVLTGLPLLDDRAPAGTPPRPTLVGRDGRPAWRPFVSSVVCGPVDAEGRAPVPRPVGLHPPDWILGGSEPGTVRLTDRWQATVTRAGLALWAPDGPRPGPVGPAVDPEVCAIELGMPGQPLDGSLLPALAQLLRGLGTDVRSRTTLLVRGRLPAGDAALRRLAAEQGIPGIRYVTAVRPSHAATGRPGTAPERERGGSRPGRAGAEPGGASQGAGTTPPVPPAVAAGGMVSAAGSRTAVESGAGEVPVAGPRTTAPGLPHGGAADAGSGLGRPVRGAGVTAGSGGAVEPGAGPGTSAAAPAARPGRPHGGREAEASGAGRPVRGAAESATAAGAAVEPGEGPPGASAAAPVARPERRHGGGSAESGHGRSAGEPGGTSGAGTAVESGAGDRSAAGARTSAPASVAHPGTRHGGGSAESGHGRSAGEPGETSGAGTAVESGAGDRPAAGARTPAPASAAHPGTRQGGGSAASGSGRPVRQPSESSGSGSVPVGEPVASAETSADPGAVVPAAPSEEGGTVPVGAGAEGEGPAASGAAESEASSATPLSEGPAAPDAGETEGSGSVAKARAAGERAGPGPEGDRAEEAGDAEGSGPVVRARAAVEPGGTRSAGGRAPGAAGKAQEAGPAVKGRDGGEPGRPGADGGRGEPAAGTPDAGRPGVAAARARVGLPFAPGHVSGSAERTAFREAAGGEWERHAAAVSRLLTRMPALRGHELDAARTDLIAAHAYLTADEGPLHHRELIRDLHTGEGRLLPYGGCLASALRRLPSYRGVALRGGGDGDLPEPAAGTLLHDPAPVSALAGTSALPSGAPVRYAIWSVTGRKVRQLLDRPGGSPEAYEEIVFVPGTGFRVLGVRAVPAGQSVVLLRELPGNATAYMDGSQELSGLDLKALKHLEDALAKGFRTGDGPGWPERCSGPVGQEG